jgi:sulfite exporter TauE/SafE
MQLWTAFLLGFVGSAHCAGMCGPLALALPTGDGKARFFAGRLLYNIGRLFTYTFMGAVFGLFGQSIAFAGWQRWLSLALGLVILAGFFLSLKISKAVPLARIVIKLKMLLGDQLKKRALVSLLVIGVLNGLLPCGLVYVACAAAAATGHSLAAAEYMVAFGLGTLPMMLIVSLAGMKLQLLLRFKLQRLIPACALAVGLLLVLRGMALGIPYVSPQSDPAAGCCHH